MSEQFLDVPKACSVPQKMCCTAMPEGVNRGFESGSFGVVFHTPPDLRIRKTPGRDRQKKGGRVCDDPLLPASSLSPIDAAHQFDPCGGDISFEPFRSGRGERHDAFSLALAFADAKRPAVEVAHVQLVKLAMPDARRVKGFEDGSVTNADRFFGVALLDYSIDLSLGQHDRQGVSGLRQLEVFGDVDQHFI